MPLMVAVILVVLLAGYAYFFWPLDMMKAPGDTGMFISHEAFDCVPRLYFFLLRYFGGGIAGFVFSGFPGSLICIVSSPWRFFLTYFVYGGLLRGFVFPVVRSVFSFGHAIASFFYAGLLSLLSIGGGGACFLYNALIRGFLIPIVRSVVNLGRDVAGIVYGGLVRGFFIPVLSSLLSFVVDIAGLVYKLVCAFIIPAVSSLASFRGGAASFIYGLLSRDSLIPFVVGLLVTPVMAFLFQLQLVNACLGACLCVKCSARVLDNILGKEVSGSMDHGHLMIDVEH